MADKKVIDVISNFQANGIKCKFFESSNDAKDYILDSIGPEQSIGIGGSKTILDMSLYDDLVNKGNAVYWHWKSKEPQERAIAFKKSKEADIYLTSSNAITAGGEIINVDGFGNRVSTMIFGPKKALIICGINKLCDDVVEALDRTRKKASPLNAKRLNKETPCTQTGECHDCNSPERICNVTTIIHKKPSGIDMELVLINEDLGY